MLLMLIIGWTAVLPALVIGGLLLVSTVLGRRTRRRGAVDVTGLARELAGFAHVEPAPIADPRPAPVRPADDRGPLGAAY